MPDFISVSANCPICGKDILLDLDKDFVLNSKRFPVQFLVEHCDQSLIAYIDEDFVIKGIQPVNNIFEKQENKAQKDDLQGEYIIPTFNQSVNDTLILSTHSDYESIINDQYPNVLEKQVLLHIAKSKQISIPMLLNKLSTLEKALNRTIDQDTILKIVENYVEKGMIIKHSIKSENKNPSANKLDMDLRGDIM